MPRAFADLQSVSSDKLHARKTGDFLETIEYSMGSSAARERSTLHVGQISSRGGTS